MRTHTSFHFILFYFWLSCIILRQEVHWTGCTVNRGNASCSWSQIRTFTFQIPGIISSTGTGFENKARKVTENLWYKMGSSSLRRLFLFLWAVHDCVLDPKLTFFIDEVGFHLSECNSPQNSRYWKYWKSVNLRQTFEMSLYSQKIGVWCAITASQIVVNTNFLKHWFYWQ
jgi:hypothetical protein